MRKRIRVVLIAITALIVLVGIVCAWSIVHEIPVPSGQYIVDGSEFLPIVWILYLVALFGIIFLFSCMCGTSCCVIWGAYWLVCFIIDSRMNKKEADEDSVPRYGDPPY